MEINGKEIVLKPYTRGIARQVQDKLTEWMIVKTVWGVQEVEMPISNNEKSEMLEVSLVTWLSYEEIDNLLETDYKKILAEIAKIKDPEEVGKKK